MRGLGRNIKFMTDFCFQLVIKSYLLLVFIWVLFGKMKDGIGVFINEEAPFFIFWVSVAFVLICAMSYSDMHFKTMVSQGSARKPAALGMLLSQYIFIGMQLVVLFGIALLTTGHWSISIKNCPLGILAVMFLLQGMGILCATLAMRGHNAWAAMLFIGTIVAFAVAGVMLGLKHDFVWSADMLKPYNSVWFLVMGLVIEIIGAFFYLKTVQKVDLKLA